MKQCSICRTPYYDEELNFCTKDGSPLRAGPPSGFDTQASTLNLSGPTSSVEKERIRTLLSLEIESNLVVLTKYQAAAKDRGKDFSQAPMGHALVLDGFKYNDLPKLDRAVWLSLLPRLPDSDLSPQELNQIHTFYKELENLDAIKKSIGPADQKMDKERDLENPLAAVNQGGNPLVH
jgi:hypothetical protein